MAKPISFKPSSSPSVKCSSASASLPTGLPLSFGVGLWMEAVEPGLPLTFLDSHIQCGNALLGATPELMAAGVPDAAWEPIEGDDKKAASALKKRNKLAAAGQRGLSSLWSEAPQVEAAEVAQAVAELEAAPDADAAALARKESRWEAILGSAVYRHQKFVADAWCAAFVWPKQSGPVAEAAPTNELWRQIRDGQGHPPAPTTETTNALAGHYHFFHWYLAFPHVFTRGGFDVVVGNPPWERVTLKEKEWFAHRDLDVAAAGTGSIRLERIAELTQTNPALHAEFFAAKRIAAGEKNLLRRSGAYPLCGQGDINTFAVFAELGRRLARGRAGMVLPTGIVTTETTQEFVADLVKRGHLVSIFDFDNRSGIFPAVQGNVRFCLITMAREPIDTIRAAAQLRGANELRDPERIWSIGRKEIARINPNTLTIPLFPFRRDAEIVRGIYARLHCLDESGAQHPDGWAVRMQRMLHMGDDSHLFKTDEHLRADDFERSGDRWSNGKSSYIPLLEAKLCHQYDHRAGTFEGIPRDARIGTHPATRAMTETEHFSPDSFAEPRYWVPEDAIRERIGSSRFLLGFRDAVSAVADSRSLVATIVPAHGVGHTLNFLFPPTARDATFVCAWFDAFVTDYVFRLKASGAHASFFLLRQLLIPGRDVAFATASWSGSVAVVDWVLPRVLELSYTSWALSGFSSECGYGGPPFRWDRARRVLLRAELDAAFFHLYGLPRDDTGYILDTFPIVRKNDEKAHGEYRTKRVILEIYDAMADAARTGIAYETRLDPPPADSRVAHPDTRGTR